MIRFGTNPIAWSNDDDRTLGADISLAQCLREAAAIGFQGIERGHKFPTDPESLKALLEPTGLQLISGWTPLTLLTRTVEQVIREIQNDLDLLQAMGCVICIAAETSNAIHGRPVPMRKRPRLAEPEWVKYATKLDRIARHVAGRGMALVYHHHVGTIVETVEEIDRLMLTTGPETGLLLDTGHCVLAGGDPAEVFDRHSARIRHLHLKNVRGSVLDRLNPSADSFLDAVRAGVFTVPGDPEGAIDFLPLLRRARDADYSGWLVVEAEQDPAQCAPADAQALGLRTVTALAEDASLIQAAKRGSPPAAG